MKKIFFTTVILLWGAVFLSLQAQDCDALPAPNVNWSGCDKSAMDLTLANLAGANLSSADLSGADLSNANLEGANLGGTNLEGANLSGANLYGANLADANLADANLAGANLIYANLIGANLSGANLSGADIYGVNLSGANLTDADLTDTRLSYANLTGANLTNATLSGADLSFANLSNANLSGANLTDATLSLLLSSGITGTPSALPADWQLMNGYLVGPSANLANANLANMNLVGVNISGANLSGANLSGANLSGANLFQTNLNGANLSDANLSGATVDQTFLQGANLTGANLTGANMGGANLDNADLSNANLTAVSLLSAIMPGANLSGANLSSTELSSTNMSGAILTGAILTGANVTNANLAGANLTNAIVSGIGIYDNNTSLYNSDLTGANLSGTNMTGADLRNTNMTNVNGLYVNLSGANLTGANLAGADLTLGNVSNTDLRNTNLAGTIMNYTHLEGSNLSGLNLVGASFGGANLDNADLSNANLTAVSLLSAIMPGANLSGANLSSTEISSSNMSGANLTGANLTGANVTSANLAGANLSGAILNGIGIYGNNTSLYNSDLTGANLSGTNMTGADLRNTTMTNANLDNANLTSATLTGVVSGGITGIPYALPTGWALVDGYLVRTFTVTFDANGGTTPSPETISVIDNTTYGELATASRPCYTFNGWFTESNGGTEITSESTVAITSNQTLYAQWTAINYNHTVTIAACDSYTWPVNGQTYTTSGTHTVSAGETVFFNSLGGLTSAVSAAGYTPSATETFDSYSQGLEGPLTGNFGTVLPTWTASAFNGLYTQPSGGSMTISTNSVGQPVTIAFSAGVTSVGANFFVTGYVPGGTDVFPTISGTITLTLSNGSSQSFYTNTANSFGGFVSRGAYITSIIIATSNDFVTIDNLVVSTGTINACASEELNLTINHPSSSTETVVACGSYEWHGTTYTSSTNNTGGIFGAPTWTGTNAAGCDSIVTLNLTINQPSYYTETIVACGSYEWHGTTYTSSTNNTGGIFGAGAGSLPTWTGTNAAGCDSIVSLDLTILNPSMAPASINSSVAFATVGVNFTLSVNGGSLGTGASWNWYTGSCGGTLVGTGASISVSQSANTTYFVRAEGTCNTTACATITVNSFCGATGVTSSAGTTAICAGSPVTLTVIGSLSPGAQWRWDDECENDDDDDDSYSNTSTFTVSPNSTKTYYVRSVGGTCGLTACVPITVNVIPKPATPGTISGSASVCPSTSVTYTIAAVTGATSYTWTAPTNATLVSAQGGTSMTVSYASAFTSGTLKVKANNCSGASSNKSLSVIKLTAPATPSTISGAAAPCKNSTQTYSIAAVANATSYTWTLPSGVTFVIGTPQTGTSIQVVVASTFNSGTLSVRSVNCGGSSSQRTLALTGGTTPTAPGTISGPSNVTQNTTNNTFSVTNVAGMTYNWTVPASCTITLGQGTNTIKVTWGTVAGTVSVTRTSACGTSVASNKSVSVRRSEEADQDTDMESTRQEDTVEPLLTATDALNAIAVYPNPTTGEARITFNTTSAGKYNLSIVDLQGRVITSTSGAAIEGNNTLDINLSNCSNSVYMIHLMYNDSLQTLRVVKM